MNQSFEFLLSQQQVEFMQTKLPSGYSFLLSTLSQPRESRITKKVARYDASFQSSKQDSFQMEDTGKRPQRSVPPIKEFKEPVNENVKKGLSLLQKIRAHPYFNDIYSAVSSFANIENIEASFTQGGSLQNLWSDLRKLFQASYQQHSKDSPEYLHTTQLENHFNELFKNVHQPPKKKPIQQQPKPDQPMSYSEKRQLGNNIRELPVEHLKGVWEIVSQTVKAEGEEEIEFDIDKLPPKVARQLERYVVTKLQSNKKKIKTDAVAQSSEHKNNNQESSFPSESSE